MEKITLYPPLFERGQEEEFLESGRSLSIAASPRDNSLAVFAGSSNEPKVPHDLNSEYPKPQDVYTASTDQIPSAEHRLFISETSVIFAAFQNLMKATQNARPLQDEPSLQAITKLCTDYVEFIKTCWVHTSQQMARDEPLQFDADHYRSLYTCFDLFVLLYAPDSKVVDVPVGDELMEWLNKHFIEPSTEEGDQLSSQDRPWEDESFWPYLIRTVLRGLSKSSLFFLEVLSTRHPSSHLQSMAEHLMPLVENHPRLSDYNLERDFVIDSRRWKDQVKSLRLELDRVPEDARQDGGDNWWDSFSDIVGILEGRPSVIQRVCLDLGADWKEVCAAWAIFVDNRLRRHELPEVLPQILDEMPPDPTSSEDMIYVSLCAGKPAKALSYAEKLDLWLAAHLADIMESVDLLDPKVDEESGMSRRQQHVLAYAEYLHSDPHLWRITVDYMYSCGVIGQERADQILMRVPFNPAHRDGTATALSAGEDETLNSEAIVNTLKEISRTCSEHNRESVQRIVNSLGAQTFLKQKNYKSAISYMIAANDWSGLGRVVDCVLAEYIMHGPETFARAAATVASSLKDPRIHQGPNGVFIHRLAFAVRYAEYHQRRMDGDFQEAALDLVSMFQEEIAPKSWWGTLLVDATELLKLDGLLLFSSSGTVELLKRLEEVNIRAIQGSEEDYLSVLVKTMKNGSLKDALQRLKVTRLALAQYYAKCTMVGAA